MIVLYIAVKIIVSIFFMLLSLLLAVLVIPFNYSASGQKFEKTTASGQISWLFGGVRIGFDYTPENGLLMILNLLGFAKKIENKQPADQSVTAKKVQSEKKREKSPYSYLTYAVVKKALETIIKILNHCKPRKFHINVKIGFDDPIYTGFLYGIKYSGYAILNKYNINVHPTFDDEGVEGRFEIRGGMQIYYLILVGIAFVFTKPFRSIIVKNIRFKIKRRLKRWRVISISTKA